VTDVRVTTGEDLTFFFFGVSAALSSVSTFPKDLFETVAFPFRSEDFGEGLSSGSSTSISCSVEGGANIAGLSDKGTEEAKLKAPGGAGVGGMTCRAGDREGGVGDRWEEGEGAV